MSTTRLWLNRLALLLIWLVLTAAVAFLVARNADDDAAVDVTAPLPPVSLDQRATVSLEEQTMVSVVSANGSVREVGDDWLLEAPATSDDLAYQLLDPPIGVKALINGGPSGFDCEWAGLGQAGAGGEMLAESSQALAPPTTGVTMRCRIPNDVRVVAGLTGTMVLQMSEPVTAQALPVTAVVGSEGQGEIVVVREDGTLVRRLVGLGVSDIYNIEITSGLEPDDVVLQNPTQADFVAAEATS